MALPETLYQYLWHIGYPPCSEVGQLGKTVTTLSAWVLRLPVVCAILSASCVAEVGH